MKRSNTSSSVNNLTVESNERKTDLMPLLHTDSVTDKIGETTLAISSITLNVIDCFPASLKTPSFDQIINGGNEKNQLAMMFHRSASNNDLPFRTKSASNSNLFQLPSSNFLNAASNSENKVSEVKLVSPYGDWCAFSGGGGSGGCIITGPYEPMILPRDDFSDESFESTEESDAAIDFTGPLGVTHNNFHNTEVVWAKRPALPWFPGIIINPNQITKEVKDLMKQLGALSPNKEQLADQSSAVSISKQSDKIFFVFLFNKKKTWMWLPESKLRPFCKENDRLFLENSPLLSSKYRKELEKAYKKAKKFSKNHGPRSPVGPIPEPGSATVLSTTGQNKAVSTQNVAEEK